MLTILKKITYKPGVCLDLYLSSKGNLIGNMKLIKKKQSNPLQSKTFNFIIYPGYHAQSCPSFKCLESTNHCIHVNVQ